MTRRIVLQRSNGTLAGLCQIQGSVEDLGPMFNPMLLPAEVVIPSGQEMVTCILVRVEPSYILYREKAADA